MNYTNPFKYINVGGVMDNPEGLNGGHVSNYNEAYLKMLRIHHSQEVINNLRTNMLFFDEEKSKYNFECIISELQNVLMETYGKMNDADRKIADGWKEDMTILLEDKPIFNFRQSLTYSGSKTIRYFSKTNWTTVRKKIFEMENFARACLEKYGYGAPNKEGQEDWE